MDTEVKYRTQTSKMWIVIYFLLKAQQNKGASASKIWGLLSQVAICKGE